jgi:ABC-type multidrug transport system fused ATPase/permease subunit
MLVPENIGFGKLEELGRDGAVRHAAAQSLAAPRLTGCRMAMSVVISHRFSTARMVNRILVLENGRFREQGSHNQLVGGGRYAELFQLQAAGYR